MFKSSNPVFSKKTYEQETINIHSGNQMTINGTIQKTALLLVLALLPAAFVWDHFFKVQEITPLITGAIIGGAIVGLILAIVTAFSPKNSMYTAPAYAIAEGFFLGGISAMFEMMYPGLVLQAVGLTFGVLLVMLYLFRSRIIQVTDKLRMGIFAATGAVALVYLVSWIMSFFGTNIPYIHGSGTIGIIFSLVVVGVAAFNLLLDFDFIERSTKLGSAKYMEWFSAFGLMVTIVWLYIEILKLLAKLRGRE